MSQQNGKTRLSSTSHLPLPDGGQLLFSIKPSSITISEDYHTTYTFDREGRLIGAFVDGMNYHRSLDNKVMKKYRSQSHGERVRVLLSSRQTRTFFEQTFERMQAVRHQLRGQEESYQSVVQWLDTILAWDFTSLEAQRTTFQSIYCPVGILPPDQYLSVVVQATEGCSWNKCSFCTFYHGRRFRIKTPETLRQHCRDVKAFFGRSIQLRKSLFLADANAIAIPQRRLLDLLNIVHDEFPIGSPKSQNNKNNENNESYTLDGIYSFLDIFGAEKKSIADYRELRDALVKRVYIGLETGDPSLFSLLNKPGSPQECVEVVRTIKEGGIGVGIIILAGVGGREMASNHLEHSIATIKQMNLDRNDIVYVSPLVVSGESDYTKQMNELGIHPLTMPEMQEQIQLVKAAWQSPTYPSPHPRVTLYDIQEFMY